MKKILVFLIVMCVGYISAQSNNPLVTSDAKAQKKWVDKHLKEMSIDEKIGQLYGTGLF